MDNPSAVNNKFANIKKKTRLKFLLWKYVVNGQYVYYKFKYTKY